MAIEAIGPSEIAEQRAEALLLKAEKATLLEQLRAGTLLRLLDWNNRSFIEARRVRDAILAGPPRTYAELAAELQVAPGQMLQVLDAAARRLLELAISQGPFPEPAPIPDVWEPEAPTAG